MTVSNNRFLFQLSLVFLLSLCSFSISLGQFENVVKWETTISPKDGLKVGDEVTFTFAATIESGYHIYAAQQPKGAYALPTSLELDEETTGIKKVGKLQDIGNKVTHYDDVMEADESYFEKKAVFVQKMKVTSLPIHIEGVLEHQVCDASRCIRYAKEINLDLDGSTTSAVKEEPKKEVVVAPTPVTTTQPKVDPPKVNPPKVETPPAVTKVDKKDPVKTPVETNATAEVAKVEKKEPEPTFDGPEIATLASEIHNATDWKQSIEPANPIVGDEVTLTFHTKIAPGNYLYSAVPPDEMANLPTKFFLDESAKGVEMVGELQEEGDRKKKYDEIFGTTIRYFEKEVTFRQKLKVTEENAHIVGFLDYSVCDESKCVPAKWEVDHGFGTGANSSATVGDSKHTITAADNTLSNQGSLFSLIIKGIIAGLFAILTPCVFPMIPLTVSFFTKQSTSRATGIRNAIIYGLSIVIIFTGLAVLLSSIFGPDVFQVVSNHPVFNIAFFLLLFIFALSFLGMFEITLPSSWSTAASKGSERGGLTGIFLMALALAIVSFSCTGPIVATALMDAFGGSFFRPIVVMAAFSTALALPFVLFAIFPGWLNSLPRSGGWLNTVKVTLGLIELALAFIYLSRADLAMSWGFLPRDVFIGSWIVIFTMLGIYLLGKIRLPHDSPTESIGVPRFLLAMSTFWFVMYLLPGMWGGQLNVLEGYIPSSTHGMGVLLLDGQVTSGSTSASHDICEYPNKVSGHLNHHTPRGFCAFYDVDQGIEYAKKVNKPVFLDFTGHTCVNCRYLEKNMWIDPVIKKMITEDFVLISLYTDDRQKLPQTIKKPDGSKLRYVGDKWLDYEKEVYGSNALPYYVLLDHEMNMLVSPKGYSGNLDLEEYRAYFRVAKEEFGKR